MNWTWILIYLVLGRSSGPASMTSGNVELFHTKEACEVAAEQLRAAFQETRRVEYVVTCISREEKPQ